MGKTRIHEIRRFHLPCSKWEEIIHHCSRKLTGRFLPGEDHTKRAYGLVAGALNGPDFLVELILPLKRNLRAVEPYKSYMDRIMERSAIPSKTPLSKRGWITDPEELRECYAICDARGFTIAGSYHVHAVAWSHDPQRDTPTKLDAVLARNSGLFTFIVSMVDMKHPVIRAFHEGIKDREVPITIERNPRRPCYALSSL